MLLIKNTHQSKIFLAATDTTALAEQTAIDTLALSTESSSVEQCKAITYTQEELQTDVKKAVVTNEDVGRYVGYGWKDISKGAG